MSRFCYLFLLSLSIISTTVWAVEAIPSQENKYQSDFVDIIYSQTAEQLLSDPEQFSFQLGYALLDLPVVEGVIFPLNLEQLLEGIKEAKEGSVPPINAIAVENLGLLIESLCPEQLPPFILSHVDFISKGAGYFLYKVFFANYPLFIDRLQEGIIARALSVETPEQHPVIVAALSKLFVAKAEKVLDYYSQKSFQLIQTLQKDSVVEQIAPGIYCKVLKEGTGPSLQDNPKQGVNIQIGLELEKELLIIPHVAFTSNLNYYNPLEDLAPSAIASLIKPYLLELRSGESRLFYIDPKLLFDPILSLDTFVYITASEMISDLLNSLCFIKVELVEGVFIEEIVVEN